MTPVDPDWLRQVADEIDEGAETAPCSQAEICRDAATEIEAYRTALGPVGAVDPNVPYPIAWKRDFLALSCALGVFQKERVAAGYQPSVGNVAKLLHHYMDRCQELLWAEVQGNLDADYQEEIDKLL